MPLYMQTSKASSINLLGALLYPYLHKEGITVFKSPEIKHPLGQKHIDMDPNANRHGEKKDNKQ